MRACKHVLVCCGMMLIPACWGNDDADAPPAAPLGAELYGTWETDCLPTDWFGLFNAKSTLLFTETGAFIRTMTRHAGAGCDNAVMSHTLTGIFVATAPSVNLVGAHNIDFIVSQAEVTPLDESAVTLLSSINYCGLETWEIGSQASILGRDCAGDDIHPEEFIENVYRIDANVLNLGDPLLLADDDDERPAAFDLEQVYRKVSE